MPITITQKVIQNMAQNIAQKPMPLSYLNADDSARITNIHAGPGISKRLSELGLISGAIVTIKAYSEGNLILSLGSTRYAVSKIIASKIYVEKLTQNSFLDAEKAKRNETAPSDKISSASSAIFANAGIGGF